MCFLLALLSKLMRVPHLNVSLRTQCSWATAVTTAFYLQKADSPHTTLPDSRFPQLLSLHFLLMTLVSTISLYISAVLSTSSICTTPLPLLIIVLFMTTISIASLKSERMRAELAGIASARERVIEMQDKADALAQQAEGAREQAKTEANQ